MAPAGAATADIVQALKRSRSLADIVHIRGGSQEELITSLVAILGAEEISLRWKAAVALCGMGCPAVGPLIRNLGEAKPFVRGSIAWILGAIGDPSAVDGLMPLLADASDDVRRETAEALGKIGDIRARKPLQDALQDQDKAVRATAAEALKRLEST
jgi:HEAT repeat protein